MSGPSYLNFDKENYAWLPGIDYRKQPILYKVGKGEQGVLICEPYKAEIGKYWRFKNKLIAKESSLAIFKLFEDYLERQDFVGADMARKYLQMGYTRARRYANYKSGIKYDKLKNYQPLERGTGEMEKANAAAIFYDYWQRAEQDELYGTMKILWKAAFG